MERVEYGNVVTRSRAVGRDREPCRPRSDDGDFFTRRFCDRRQRRFIVRAFPIRDEPFEPSDRNRFIDRFVNLSDRTFLLTLLFLRAHAAADRRQKVRQFNRVDRRFEVPLLDFRDELRNRDADGAACDTGFVFALETAVRFVDRHLFRIAERDFAHFVRTFFRIRDRHFLKRDRHAVFRRKRSGFYLPFDFVEFLFRLRFQFIC